MASVVCWNTADYRWVALFTVSLPKDASLWGIDDFTEGWVALLGAYPDKKILSWIESHYRASDVQLQRQWESHCLDRFGPMVNVLFQWNPAFQMISVGKSVKSQR